MTGFSVGSGGSGGLSAMLAKAVDSNTGRHHQVFRIGIPASFQDEIHILERPHCRVCKPMAHPPAGQDEGPPPALSRCTASPPTNPLRSPSGGGRVGTTGDSRG